GCSPRRLVEAGGDRGDLVLALAAVGLAGGGDIVVEGAVGVAKGRVEVRPARKGAIPEPVGPRRLPGRRGVVVAAAADDALKRIECLEPFAQVELVRKWPHRRRVLPLVQPPPDLVPPGPALAYEPGLAAGPVRV